MKSYIMRLSLDYNTHLHTLSKKEKNLNEIIIKKNKGGAGHQVPKKHNFLRRQKFLADGMAGVPKNRPSDNFDHIVHSTSRNLNFNQKQKSYAC